MTEDAQLLRQYVEERSEAAFTELVHRHVNLVYFAALRRVGGNAHLADDVMQSVFVDLARKAPSLRDRSVLTGWLYTSTRFAAAQAVRAERRRRTHEQEAHTMHELHSTPEANWEQLRPVIDEAMDELNEREREALLLRFFENRPLAEVGARFTLTPDAARMRVDRALDKLRGLLAKRGIASTATALAAIFASQSGLAAPAGSVARIVATAFSQAGAATAVTLSLGKILLGSALTVLGIGLVVHQVWTPKSETGDRAVPTAVQDATPSSTAEVAAAEIVAMPTPAPGPALTQATPTAAPSTLSAGAEFGALSEMQQDILKRLWEHQKVSPATPPLRWGFRPAPASPDVMAFEMAVARLATHGWVGSGKTGMVFLTDSGATFCQAAAGEIDAHPSKIALFRPGNPASVDPENQPLPAAGDFSSLPEQQKDILKTLWEHQKIALKPGWAFRPALGSPNLTTFDEAAAGLQPTGWVVIAPRTRMVSLTGKGSEFCQAHAAELDAHVLKFQAFRPLLKN